MLREASHSAASAPTSALADEGSTHSPREVVTVVVARNCSASNFRVNPAFSRERWSGSR
ncbi:hypothetical protein N136_03589 [Leifsonia aquatica ATCC 14665]|uniref:Uncharacterized protein n=1 Tax=Leifsonia aquatica ATCC 14665 TaxID=1358026 RepID=U2RND8_LEIAQ|nr:hypothetical protein N136_03589 [Leifsonia aquatica ATCC 14665]